MTDFGERLVLKLADACPVPTQLQPIDLSLKQINLRPGRINLKVKNVDLRVVPIDLRLSNLHEIPAKQDPGRSKGET